MKMKENYIKFWYSYVKYIKFIKENVRKSNVNPLILKLGKFTWIHWNITA